VPDKLEIPERMSIDETATEENGQNTVKVNFSTDRRFPSELSAQDLLEKNLLDSMKQVDEPNNETENEEER
jgi:hypothetical protein